MRMIPWYTSLIVIAVYWLITLSAWRIISGWLKETLDCHRRLIRWFFYGTSVLVTLFFCLIYFIHLSQSAFLYYFFHSFFNAILVTDVISKLPFAVAGVISLFVVSDRMVKVMAQMGFILSSGLFFVILSGIFQGTTNLTVQQYSLSFRNLPPAFDGLRIVHFSDTHLGSYYKTSLISRFTAVSEAFCPDLVLFTGDLVNNYGTEVNSYIIELQQFTSSIGNFAALGNHDYGDYTKWPDYYEKALNFNQIKSGYQNAGFRLLCNESDKLVRGKDSVYIVGLENPGHKPFPAYADKEKAIRQVPDSAFCILMCHDPGYWDSEIRNDPRFPLTLSGHTHGLQLGIHVAGIGFSPVKLIRKSWGGLYEYDGQYLYVNRGTGMVGTYFRIDMPAEITLLTLKRAEIN